MRIGFITAGAAGMFCGSCMRDNTLVTALRELGHDALLIPTYTPIRTDDIDVSQGRIFYGGINVFLQDRSWIFRHTPRFIDWLLNRPALLRFVSKRAVSMSYASLAELTVSMLKGKEGRQRKELAKLVEWLGTEAKPEVIVLTNALLSGMVPAVKEALGVPVLVTLQGDDIYLDALPPAARKRCIAEIRRNDKAVDAYICTSRFYADYMADYLGVSREKMDVVYPGINLKGHGGPRPDRAAEPPTIGYFARICPEKGFQNIVDAFIHLRRTPGAPAAKLKASGWLGAHQRAFYDEQVAKLTAAGLAGDFEHVECPDHDSKVRFIHSIDVLSVPTTYHEPKGLYVLEAWANGVPVVQPRHGSFPELIGATGGGLLCEPENPADLAAVLRRLLEQPDLRTELAQKGRDGLHARFTARVMAEETLAVLYKRAVPAASR
ncbi:glycosyltransferase family 4 protein [Fimbriiglobus ruber]|uniref:Glycosyl transferase, group 1 n=1 Tax=Fimbriiglobus ruber TaxID=1908690 RepID=A0A225E9R6_9BACT|nr:glycosyltransferase family 4 protein [Fimbriiglobus ruber]OWK47478.1 Glycosyl transferase, group 1 [Fimbriiglobus ruber]